MSISNYKIGLMIIFARRNMTLFDVKIIALAILNF